MSIVFCHIVDHMNIGDLVSCPAKHLRIDQSIETWITDIFKPVIGSKPHAIIFGGGGMLHPEIDIRILDLANRAKELNPECKIVVWGIGTNYHDIRHGAWPEWLKGFDLVGVRDYGEHGFFQVPCVSCMHKAFDANKPKTKHSVCYTQARIPVSFEGMQTLDNSCDYEDFDKVIEFIGQSQTLFTNSFHGAYWALLCNTAPVIVDSFSNRFHCALPQGSVKHVKASEVPSVSFFNRNQEWSRCYKYWCREQNKTMLRKVNNLLGTEMRFV